MRVLLFLLLSLNLSFAGLFDFYYINKAEKSAEEKDYYTANEYYSKLEGDEALYNQGVSLYKMGNYSGALEKFSEVNSTKLEFEKLHNMGNSYAFLGDRENAIISYEKALAIREDKDTRFNLNLLKREQEEQEKEEEKKEDEKMNEEQDEEEKADKEKEENDEKDQEKKEDKEYEDTEESGKQREAFPEEQGEKDSDKDSDREDFVESSDDKQGGDKKVTIENEPISELEENRWQREFDSRRLNTFMLPLYNEGEDKEDEKKLKPW
ncbi:MAG: tetratricopeptide repeat protein [Campylobacteraceae bacterium]|nr:tetratricopeptide repeat protein [Campylobacteraceae bacterium]